MALWCRCPCHNSTRADFAEAALRENLSGIQYYAGEPLLELPPMIAMNDRVEAALSVGCTCNAHHWNVFAPRPTKYLPPKDWTPDATGDND